ncbi:MAG: DUF2071 domain-containing protein [Cytophagales bacterium]|nr:MAG: DUF2071 domain-containing protein [Cytophagales bacterium]
METSSPKPFLRAEWRKLLMFNYAIDPEIVAPLVPKGTEIDFFQNRTYLSVVGFMFQNTRLLGIGVPFHTHFEEVNLRFYIKRYENGELRRGVAFVKEIVPKPAISWVANTLYNEHYQTLSMAHEHQVLSSYLSVKYSWKASQKWHQMSAEALATPEEIPEGSEAEFITEHYWGYTRQNENKTLAYQVAHPRWQVYPIQKFRIDCDFEQVYGKNFASSLYQRPTSVLLAEGSPITVGFAQKLKQ